jgi:hypothetical protein
MGFMSYAYKVNIKCVLCKRLKKKAHSFKRAEKRITDTALRGDGERLTV